jgi:predicted nucleic acid-binding protein
MNYILDACALLAVYKREPGWEKVNALTIRAAAGDILLYIHMVNLLEVYYGIRREKGPELAQEILDYVDASAIQITDDVSIPLIREAGRFKAAYDMSLADTFVCAAASLLSATVVTADGELKPVEVAEPVAFFWFRPPKEKQPKAKTDVNALIQRTEEAERALAEAKRRIAELEASLLAAQLLTH